MMVLKAALLLFGPTLAAAQQVCASDNNGDGTVGVDGEHACKHAPTNHARFPAY